MSTTSTKTAKTTTTAKDRKALATKPPTDMQKNFAKWLEEQTGVKVDVKSVQLAASLRHEFQVSKANQDDLKRRRAAAKKAEAEKVAAKRAKLLKEAAALGIEVKAS